MCSVVGYVGKKYSRAVVMEGLSRLEYRGYDSAGFACVNPENNRLQYAKAQGKLSELMSRFENGPLDGFLGIGHTRWSTHGAPTEANAHPQFDCHKKISIVHNGIIENHHVLRQKLVAAGHVFCSDSDTEVAAHLLEDILEQERDGALDAPALLKKALVSWLELLEGAYAFLLIMEDYPEQMIVVRKRSPLCVGIGTHEMFVASDPLAFAGKASTVVYLPDESFAFIKRDSLALYAFDGELLPTRMQELSLSWTHNEKMGHEHFMLKEMYEQKGAITATVGFYQGVGQSLPKQMGISSSELARVTSLSLIGCGTSWHAARIGQFFFESVCKMPTRVLLASEFRYMPFFAETDSLCIAISQSGETADTLEAVRMINRAQGRTVALTNVPSSTMVRESGGFLLTQAGPEIAVASTKAFSTQIAALYWLAHRFAVEKGFISVQALSMAETDLLVAAEVLENSIESYRAEIEDILARRYANYSRAIFLGRHISYPFAMEAALKLKEISYIFAQGYPAGELKHGPIALIDDATPVFLFSVLDPLIYQKLVSNAQEVKARSGHLVVFAFEGQEELISLADYAFVLPRVTPLLGPLAMTGLMQFFVYAVAKELGRPIDKPRNLAKSVTVE